MDINLHKDKEIQELFNMVYQWGRVGIVTDYTCPAFQDKLKECFLTLHNEINTSKLQAPSLDEKNY